MYYHYIIYKKKTTINITSCLFFQILPNIYFEHHQHRSDMIQTDGPVQDRNTLHYNLQPWNVTITKKSTTKCSLSITAKSQVIKRVIEAYIKNPTLNTSKQITKKFPHRIQFSIEIFCQSILRPCTVVNVRKLMSDQRLNHQIKG